MQFRIEKSATFISEDEAFEFGAKRVTLKGEEYSRFIVEIVSTEELILLVQKVATKGYEVVVKIDYYHKSPNIPVLELIPTRESFI